MVILDTLGILYLLIAYIAEIILSMYSLIEFIEEIKE